MIAVFAKAYRFILVMLLIYTGILAQQVGLVDYLSVPSNYMYINKLLWEHIRLVAISMFFATLLGVSIGIVLTRKRFRKFAGVVMYIVGLGQTIPSLAVLALMMSILGIGVKTAIFALFVYSILPIARNTLAGITAVPPAMIDAAKGMGMPGWRILWEVEIPNSMQIILTGFRVALVINIGTAALSYLVGAGGLGDLIFTGISLMKTRVLLAGAIPTTLLALFADYLCEVLGLLLVSKGLRLEQ
ncbi:MAG: ABC transporter permease [Desulfonatronovibrionaceae bacterium]